MNVEMPDGTIIPDVPDDATQADIMARYRNMQGMQNIEAQAGSPPDYSKVFGYEELSPMQMLAGMAAANVEGQTLGFGGEIFDATGPESQRGVFEGYREPFAQQYPLTNFAAEMSGVLANPLTRKFGARAVAAKPIIGSGYVGGVTGGLYGAGKADPGERLKEGAIGAGLGIPFGFAGGYGAQLMAQKLIPFGMNMANRLTKKFSGQDQADALLRPMLQSAFSDADDPAKAAVMAAANLGPEGRLMDLSPEMQALTRSLYQKQVIPQGPTKRFLTNRSDRTINRLTRKLNRTLGTQGKDYSQFIKETLAGRAKDANPLYEQAYKEAVDPDVLIAYSQKLKETVSDASGTGFGSALRRVNNALYKTVDGEKIPKTDVRALSYVRDDLADAASKAWKSGEFKKWRFLRDQVDEFDQIMPKSYRDANQKFSEASRLIDASDEGLNFFKPSTKSHELAEWIDRATESEKHAYLTGMVEAAKQKMGNIKEGGRVARIFDTPNVKERLIAVIGDEQAANKFIQSVESENIMKTTQEFITGNSLTRLSQNTDEIVDNLLGKVHEMTPTSQGEYIKATVKKIVDTIKVDKTISRDLAKGLEKRLTEEGLNQRTLKILLRTPIREKVINTLQGIVPEAGAAASKPPAMAYPAYNEQQ